MIRQATIEDIPEIIELYKAGLEEIGFNDWKQDLIEKKVESAMYLAPCFVAVFDGKTKRS